MEILQPPLQIVHYPHPSLRHPAKPLSAIDRKVVQAAEAMLELMYEHRGLGLAAPQVGLPFQMFVANYAGDREQRDLEGVFINPVLIEKRGSMEGDEGCLSFPDLFQKVARARTVRVQAYNLQGQLIEGEFSDLPAHLAARDRPPARRAVHRQARPDRQAGRPRRPARVRTRLPPRQQRGEIPSDPEIEKRLSDLEAAA